MDSVESRRAALERRYPRWPSWTLASALDAVAAEHPERPCVLAEDRSCTYAELAEWSSRLARGLVAEGVGAGEKVALLLPNGAEMVALFFAVARAGAVAVRVNPLLRERELGYVFAQSDSVAFVACEAFRDLDHAAHLDALLPGWREGGRRVWMAAGAASGRPLAALERGADPALDAELAARAPAA